MKTFLKILAGLAVLLVIIQFIPVTVENPAVKPTENLLTIFPASPKVETLLKESCYDCHSNESKPMWYSGIAPVSWLLKSDVEEGRERLNFSEFTKFNRDQQNHAIQAAIQEVESGTMPLPIYLTTHPKAQLSTTDRQVLNEYFRTVQTAIQDGKLPSVH